MTSGIQSKGVDLDNIFALYASGTHPANTGIKVNGVDIAQRYQPLPGAAAPATGIMTGGADLNTLFSKTAVTSLPIDGQSFPGLDTAPSGATTAAQENVNFSLNSDGSYTVTRAGYYSGNATLASGTWLTFGGAASDYQTLMTLTMVTQSGAGSTTNSAAAWTTLSTNIGAGVSTTTPAQSGETSQWQYSLRIQIRKAAGGQVVSDTTITLNAKASSLV